MASSAALAGRTTIAAFQCAATRDLDKAVTELRRCLRLCDARGVDIACFPECYLGGYFPNDAARSAAIAFDLSGSRFSTLAASLAEFRVTAIVGLTERRGSQLRNTAVVLQAGTMIGAYAKTHPNEAFFAPGDRYPVFSLHGLTVGVNICNDANVPEAAAAVAAQGGEVIVMPLNNRMRRHNADAWRDRHIGNLTARATETRCYVVAADVVAEGPTRMSYGCTAIVTPQGDVAARVPERTVGHVVTNIVSRPLVEST